MMLWNTISLFGLFVAATNLTAVVSHEEDASWQECGAKCEAFNIQPAGLRDCLASRFSWDESQLYGFKQVPKVTFPSDPDYFKVKHTYGGDMYPAVVVYVENDDEVVSALECAYQNGYQVSARGRGHQYQGLSTMHGHVVIDMSLTCNPDEFEVDRSDTGPHILKGQQYIATLKVQAGCTTAVVTSFLHSNFDPSEGALSTIGGCPSVGLVGFALGGGSGDATPWMGWFSDVVSEFEVVLHNGTKVIANESENPSLYWASRGGGGGFGVVTSLTLKVVQGPAPKHNQNRKYTWLDIPFDTSTPEKLDMFLSAFQYFLYEYDPVQSGKYGGGARIATPKSSLKGLFLGSWQELVEDWTKVGLLDANFLVQEPGSLWVNYDVKCSNDDEGPCDVEEFPSFGRLDLKEFETYGESMAYKLCVGGAGASSFRGTERSADVCTDLGLDEKFCVPVPDADFNNLACTADKEIYDAILAKMIDPQSYLNVHGTFNNSPIDSRYGGVVFTKLEHETLVDLANIGFSVAHFQHAAPMLVDKDEAAIPWRDTAYMTQFTQSNRKLRGDFLTRLSQDAAYGGDVNNLSGYYNYLFPAGDTDWKKFYFDDRVEELEAIRGQYDPMDLFGKPFYVTSAPPKMSGKMKMRMKMKKSSERIRKK